MSAQHCETYKATSSWHSVWIMVPHMASEFKLRFLALVWHGSMQWGWCVNIWRAREGLKIMLRCTISMATFMPPKPTRNGPRTKEPLPTMQKEGTRNVQERFIFSPIVLSDVPGFGALGTRINVKLKRKHRNAGAVVKWQFLLNWCKNASYSKVSAKTVRAPASHGLQACFLGSQKQAFLVSWL